MRKSSILAAFLSFCLPGLGQIYVRGMGGIARACMFWIASIVFAVTGIGIIVVPLIWIWCIFDAWELAGGKNRDNKLFKALTKPKRM